MSTLQNKHNMKAMLGSLQSNLSLALEVIEKQKEILNNLRGSNDFHANNVTTTWDCNGENVIQSSSEIAKLCQGKDIEFQKEVNEMMERLL